jgi:Holliday junction resolvase-like predicted endonuclease
VNAYQVGVAAEAYAAAQFAHAGCNVLVQYGANQPEYDLVVSDGKRMRQVSVKGSQDGGWVLAASQKKSGQTYHQALDDWAAKHSDRNTFFCFVQFKGVAILGLPRVYLATVTEVVRYLKASCGGHGYTSLRERYNWKRGKAAGTSDTIPPAWRMSPERMAALMKRGRAVLAK